jgi:hypothetical protein
MNSSVRLKQAYPCEEGSGREYVWKFISLDAYIIKNCKEHHVSRQWCSGCGELLSEVHYDCCGHGANGMITSVHKCKKG